MHIRSITADFCRQNSKLMPTAGFTHTTTVSSLSSSSFTAPTYSVSVRWNVTPKVTFVARVAESVAPPQDIVADYERIQTESLTAIYLFSPKLSFNGSVGISTIKNPTATGVGQSPFLANQKVWYTSVGAIYQVSPFLNATADYRYTNRQDLTTGLPATSNLFMLGLAYQH